MTYPTDEQVEAAAKACWRPEHRPSTWDDLATWLKDMYRAQARTALQAVFTPEFVQQMAENKRDAERYRWLRDPTQDVEFIERMAEEELDDAIDAAMRSAADKGGA